jgi:DNA-binding response OmpR family regulator
MINYDKLYTIAKNFNVLFVEDDEDFLETSSEIFSNIFHSIEIARDGKEGLEKYHSYFLNHNRYYDMVISDFHMPFMNGIELCKEIFKIHPTQSIVIISAFNQPDDLINFINLGIKKFLLKPFEVQNMVDVLYEASSHVTQNNQATIEEDSFVLGENILWDKRNKLLLENGQVVKLPRKEHLFLELLVKNGQKITVYEEIYHFVWEDEYYLANQNTLKSIISRLRAKLSKDIIQNIAKSGYRLQLYDK